MREKREPYGRRPVVAVSSKGEMAGYFDSLKDAAAVVGSTQSNICRAIRLKTFVKKLRWMYEEDYREMWMQGRTEELSYNRKRLLSEHIQEALHNLPEDTRRRRSEAIRAYQKKEFLENPDCHLRRCQQMRRRRIRVVGTGEEFGSIRDFCLKYGASPGNAWRSLNTPARKVHGMKIEYID